MKYIKKFLYPTGKACDREKFALPRKILKKEKVLDEPVREMVQQSFIEFEMIREFLTGYCTIFEFVNDNQTEDIKNKAFTYGENKMVSMT